MEQEDTAISKTQIGLGAELWSMIHMIRVSKEPDFDPTRPPELSDAELEELTGIDVDARFAIIARIQHRLKDSVIH